MASSFLLLCLLRSLDGGVDAGVDFSVTPVVAPAYTPELSFFIVAGGVASGNGSRQAPRSSLAVVGVGALSDTPLPEVTKPLPAVGLGLRVRVQDRVTARFDFGVGRESFAFYFQFLEAF